jgi:diadenosine tetraphosphate (Ap4A) HIT family hydrolase
MNQDCPFCTGARKENRILKEGKYAYVIFSNPRLMPGHILVIPKRHVEGRLEELTVEERGEIFDFLSEFQAKILKKISSGCDIRQNYKPYVENSRTHINHLHFHLNPREYKDELYEKVDVYRKAFYRDLTEEEKNRLFALFSDP